MYDSVARLTIEADSASLFCYYGRRAMRGRGRAVYDGLKRLCEHSLSQTTSPCSHEKAHERFLAFSGRRFSHFVVRLPAAGVDSRFFPTSGIASGIGHCRPRLSTRPISTVARIASARLPAFRRGRAVSRCRYCARRPSLLRHYAPPPMNTGLSTALDATAKGAGATRVKMMPRALLWALA